MSRLRQTIGAMRRKWSAWRSPPLPASGYAPADFSTPRLAALSDVDLDRLNSILPWQCFTTDDAGRRFGHRAWKGKREEPQPIPDRRIELLHTRYDLSDKSVLEIGCFEGVHTAALCARAARVMAVDSRVENVIKTLVRCHYYGHAPDVRQCNVESSNELASLGDVDIVHHVGVLYHLVDPVAHLHSLAALTRVGMMLDTHVARPAEATSKYELGGRHYAYRKLEESGVSDAFSGMYDHAKWLTCDAMVSLLRELGFASVNVHEERDERNGLRILLFAQRTVTAANASA